MYNAWMLFADAQMVGVLAFAGILNEIFSRNAADANLKTDGKIFSFNFSLSLLKVIYF